MIRKEKINRIASKVTDKVGTGGFFLIIISWTFIWLGWNTLSPRKFQFDPYPAFVLWLFISNMIQICLMPLILIGQNLQTKKMNDIEIKDYVLDQKMEREIQEIKKLLQKILETYPDNLPIINRES